MKKKKFLLSWYTGRRFITINRTDSYEDIFYDIPEKEMERMKKKVVDGGKSNFIISVLVSGKYIPIVEVDIHLLHDLKKNQQWVK